MTEINFKKGQEVKFLRYSNGNFRGYIYGIIKNIDNENDKITVECIAPGGCRGYYQEFNLQGICGTGLNTLDLLLV